MVAGSLERGDYKTRLIEGSTKNDRMVIFCTGVGRLLLALMLYEC